MASRRCWKCGCVSHMTDVQGWGIPNDGGGERFAAAFRCDNCKWPSVGIVRGPLGSDARDVASWVAGQMSAPTSEWQPMTASGQDFPDVPSVIASAADEAYRCRSIDAVRAATLMARVVIEATCKDQNANGKDLNEKIDALLITPTNRTAAHNIRFFGNDAAHADFIDPDQDILPEEADEILDLMRGILTEVYVQPARNARLQAARKAKKSK